MEKDSPPSDAGPENSQTQRLIAKILAGNEAAFNVFYELYCDRLFRYLLVMTRGDEMVARDLLQQVFLKSIRYLKPFETEAMLWSWLTQLCKTIFIDHFRRTRREARTVISVDVLPAGIETLPAEAEADLMDALQTSLTQLSDEERHLIEFIYFEDQPQKQVARVSGLSRKAVESRLARIRRRLKHLILTALNDHVRS